MGYYVDINWYVLCKSKKAAELLQRKLDSYTGDNWMIKNLKIEGQEIQFKDEDYGIKLAEEIFLPMLDFIKLYIRETTEILCIGEDSERWGYWFHPDGTIRNIIFPPPEQGDDICYEPQDETIDMIERERIKDEEEGK